MEVAASSELSCGFIQVREHQHRLRVARTALSKGRRQVQHLLHSREFWMERSWVLDGVIRTSQFGRRRGECNSRAAELRPKCGGELHSFRRQVRCGRGSEEP